MLFCRNIKSGLPPAVVQAKFERMGEIKRFFNRIDERGMAFITYFDLRAACVLLFCCLQLAA